ncbi:MAG: hypothetical protein RL670_698 [Actinomycetota bacterium]
MHAIKAQLLDFLAKRGVSPAKAVFLVGIAAVALWMLLGSLQETEPKPTSTPMATPAPTIEPPKLFIHVVGAVVHPGIYQLDFNNRVFDAIEAAGGFSDSADEGSVNLARVLADGEQIVVTKQGEAAAVGASIASGSGSALINLNRATVAELDTLPGIGPAIAARIIDWRTANGGFRKKEDLMQVKGIGKKLFANIKDSVTF